MNREIVLKFIDAINTANVDQITDLMTRNHLFIDARENKISGKEKIKIAWREYFSLFPDYKIEITEILENENLICLIGYASGTYKNRKNNQNSNYWKIPAAWTAIIEGNLVKHWQVYADNTVVMEIINRNRN